MDLLFLKRDGWLVLLNHDQAMPLLLNLCHTFILLPTMTICQQIRKIFSGLLKNDFKNDHSLSDFFVESNSIQLRICQLIRFWTLNQGLDYRMVTTKQHFPLIVFNNLCLYQTLMGNHPKEYLLCMSTHRFNIYFLNFCVCFEITCYFVNMEHCISS